MIIQETKMTKKSISSYVFLLSSEAINIMVIKEAADCNYIYYRGRLHCYNLLYMLGSMVEKDSEDAW
jgi:uncharacterized membrane protein YwaF